MVGGSEGVVGHQRVKVMDVVKANVAREPLQHLRQPDGVLAVHVSNRFLDLGRVVYGLADACGLQALRFSDPGGPGVYKADWMLLTSSPRVLT